MAEKIRQNILRGIHKLHHERRTFMHPLKLDTLNDSDILAMLHDMAKDYNKWRGLYFDLFSEFQESEPLNPPIPFYWTIALKELSELEKILESGGWGAGGYKFKADRRPQRGFPLLMQLPSTQDKRVTHLAGAVLQILKDATALFPFARSITDSDEYNKAIVRAGELYSERSPFEDEVVEKFDKAIDFVNVYDKGPHFIWDTRKHIYNPWYSRDWGSEDGEDFGGGRTKRGSRKSKTIRRQQRRGSRNSRKPSRRVRGRTKRKKKRKVRSKTYKRTKRRTNKQSNRKTNKRSNRRYGNKNRLMVGGNYSDLIRYLEQSKDQGEITQETKEEISKFFQSETGASDEEHRKAYAFIKQKYSSFLDNINSIIMETNKELARNLKIEMSSTTRESRKQPKPGFKKFRSEYAEGLGEFRREDPLSDDETDPPPSVSSSRGSIDVKSRWNKDDGMDDPARDRPSLAKQLIISAQAFGIEMTEEEAMEYLRMNENNVEEVIVKLIESENL